MPPKDSKDGKKQVTLMGFFNKAAPSNGATPAKAQSTLKSSASSASTAAASVAPTPESKRVREPSKAVPSSSPDAKSSSSTA
ncbi:hypothetical protein FRC01_008080, partial [Tulasnella sp. 417]